MMARSLSGLMPHAAETAFLKACLLGGDAGSRSWAEWQTRVDEPRRAFAAHPGYRRLGPLLDAACGARGLAVDDPKLLTALRAASVREKLRHDALLRISSEVLATLQARDVDAIVLGGVALAELDYPRPERRHTHDLDLLVRDVAAGAAALRAQNLRVDEPGDGSARARHESGVPIGMHASAFVRPAPAGEGAWPRVATRPLPAAGASARSLDGADTLVAACLKGFGRARTSLVWVADAYFTIARGVDWERVVARRRTSPALLVALSYIASTLDAPVPATVIAELGDRARSSDTTRLAASVAWDAGKRRAAVAWRAR